MAHDVVKGRRAFWVVAAVRGRNFWVWLAALGLVAALHSGSSNPLRTLLAQASLRLTPCLVERLLFLAPVALASWAFGPAAGFLTIAVSFAVMLWRALVASCRPSSAWLEIVAIVILAIFFNWIVSRLRAEQQGRDRERQIGLERLRASERRFRGLFENASDAIWLQDGQGRIVEMNAACSRLTGYQPEELVGIPSARFLQQPIAEGNQEQTLRRKDGSEVIAEVVVSAIPGDGGTTGWLAIARDVTERHLREESTRFFARQILRAQEEERRRIARDLHDSTVQTLVAVSNQLEALALNSHELPLAAAERTRRVQRLVRDAVADARRFSQNLRPPALDDLGLLPSLEELAADLRRDPGLTVEVLVLGQDRRLNSETELALYRVVQESLSNVRRHARASEVIINLRFFPDGVRIVVRDDGQGCTLPEYLGDLTASGCLGLAGIYERAHLLGGRAEIRSKPGQGTAVVVELPG
ncbi:MAG: sensor histidine kinase [Anaerolineae bacterium]